MNSFEDADGRRLQELIELWPMAAEQCLLTNEDFGVSYNMWVAVCI